jgi:hypothetical protein
MIRLEMQVAITRPTASQDSNLEKTRLKTSEEAIFLYGKRKPKPSASVNLLEPAFETKEEEDQAGCLLCPSSKRMLHKNR